MKKLSEEIKSGQLKQVYILYGEEAYLRSQYKDKLKTALLGDGDAMNFHYFEGKDVRSQEVIDLGDHAGEQRTIFPWRRGFGGIYVSYISDRIFCVCGTHGG